MPVQLNNRSSRNQRAAVLVPFIFCHCLILERSPTPSFGSVEKRTSEKREASSTASSVFFLTLCSVRFKLYLISKLYLYLEIHNVFYWG